MARLLQNTFMNTAAVQNRESERVNFLDQMFSKQQPIFKHYLKNNAQILREDRASQRIQ
jgi:hypothetical protein